jgi:hypothetical protein
MGAVVMGSQNVRGTGQRLDLKTSVAARYERALWPPGQRPAPAEDITTERPCRNGWFFPSQISRRGIGPEVISFVEALPNGFEIAVQRPGEIQKLNATYRICVFICFTGDIFVELGKARFGIFLQRLMAKNAYICICERWGIGS